MNYHSSSRYLIEKKRLGNESESPHFSNSFMEEIKRKNSHSFTDINSFNISPMLKNYQTAGKDKLILDE